MSLPIEEKFRVTCCTGLRKRDGYSLGRLFLARIPSAESSGDYHLSLGTCCTIHFAPEERILEGFYDRSIIWKH